MMKSTVIHYILYIYSWKKYFSVKTIKGIGDYNFSLESPYLKA